jgi:hypothetical protein
MMKMIYIPLAKKFLSKKASFDNIPQNVRDHLKATVIKFANAEWFDENKRTI